MKGDRAVCLAAVQQHVTGGRTLQYASEAMRRNEKIVIAAIQSHLKGYPADKGDLGELKKMALEYIPEQMLQNSNVRKAAGI